MFYAPVPAAVELAVRPELDCWDAAGSPARARLDAYLEEAERALGPAAAAAPDPLGLSLDVALPAGTDLLKDRDLDNYLFPLARRIERAAGRELASATAAKRHGAVSRAGAGRAVAAPPPPGRAWRVRTSATAGGARYKQQVRDALAGAVELPPGPVVLDVVFGVGPGRSWLNLWKATIDALSPVLGADGTGRPWNPQDGRVVRLGLHRWADGALGHGVDVQVLARGC